MMEKREGGEGDGAISLDVEGEGEGDTTYREKLGAFDRGREKICSVSGFREYEKFKSLPCFARVLEQDCSVSIAKL